MLVLITIVAARSSNSRDVSYLKALKRLMNRNNNNYMQNEMILRNNIEDRAAKRKYRLVAKYFFFRYRELSY
jgi:hypothetical protein